MWRFYLSLIVGALSFAERPFSMWQTAMAIVAAIAAGYGLKLVGLSTWWFFLPLGILILFSVLWVNYQRYRGLEQQVIERDGSIHLLQDRLLPKLEMIFGPGPPFEKHDVWTGSNEVQRRYYRIGVWNKSAVTIYDVVVRLEELLDLSSDPPGKSPVPPIVLRQMNDDGSNNGQYRQSFMLNPGDIRYIEVTWKPEADLTVDSDEIRLGYAQTAPSLIPCRRHHLFIQATGRDVPAVGQWFFVDVDSNGCLLFGPAEVG